MSAISCQALGRVSVVSQVTFQSYKAMTKESNQMFVISSKLTDEDKLRCTVSIDFTVNIQNNTPSRPDSTPESLLSTADVRMKLESTSRQCNTCDLLTFDSTFSSDVGLSTFHHIRPHYLRSQQKSGLTEKHMRIT